jgi:hypothetical protein
MPHWEAFETMPPAKLCVSRLTTAYLHSAQSLTSERRRFTTSSLSSPS